MNASPRHNTCESSVIETRRTGAEELRIDPHVHDKVSQIVAIDPLIEG